MYGDCLEQAVGGDKQPGNVVTGGPLEGAADPHPQDPCYPLQPMAGFCLQAGMVITTGLTCQNHRTSFLEVGGGGGEGRRFCVVIMLAVLSCTEYKNKYEEEEQNEQEEWYDLSICEA